MSSGRCILGYHLDGQPQSIEMRSAETIIGRSFGQSDVVVPSPNVSRRHAVVRCEQNNWTIADLGAANGTWVNGRRLEKDQKYTLNDGDKIMLGTVPMTVSIVTSRPAASVQFDDDGHGEAEAALPLDELTSVLGGVAWVVDLFNDAAEGLLGSNGLDVTLEQILTLVFKHVPAHRGSICLYDGDRLVHRASRTSKGTTVEPPRLSQTIVQQAIKDRKAFLYKRDNMGGREAESIVALEIRSAMCVPLVSGEKVIGLVYADTKNLAQPFTNEHLKLVSTLAKFSAVAVEQAHLHEVI
ncbi:MAG: FHA domain-containing protein, partial [Vicinamibacterales bacterium]